jgi:protein-tyrosine phosphatase
MAEALLQAELGPKFRVESAGFNALVDQPADAEVERLMKVHGHDISLHRGRQWNTDMALGADLIFVMDEPQKYRCELSVPSIRGRVFLLGHWLTHPSREIPDPIGLGSATMHRTFELIQQSVACWLPHLMHQQRSV